MVEYEEEGSAEDESLKEMVEVAVQRLYDALNPVMWPADTMETPPNPSPYSDPEKRGRAFFSTFSIWAHKATICLSVGHMLAFKDVDLGFVNV